MKTATAASSSNRDEDIRAALLAIWSRMEGGVAAHCGGVGLAVGCPVCGRRYGAPR